MENALLEPSHPAQSSRPVRIPFISISNAAELAKKSWEARRARAASQKLALSLLPDSLHEPPGHAPNALELTQTHRKESLAANILPDQEKRVAELNSHLDGINRLIDKATTGEIVTGQDKFGNWIFAKPKDIQALSKARRDILEMLFRIHCVSREPIAKTPTSNTKRRSNNIAVD